MKIGINAFCFRLPATGLGQYLLHLANTLMEIDQCNEYVMFGPGSATPEDFRHPEIHSVYAAPSWTRNNANIEKVTWEQWTGPAAAQKAGVDIFHYPYFAAPLLPRTPTISTIGDLIHFRLPQYLEGPIKKTYMRMNMQAAYKAALLITFSKHARQDIVDLMHIPPERVRVIYLAAGDEYHPVLDPSKQTEVRARYGVGEHYIFYLGGFDQRKNVLQLVRAFAQLCYRIANPNLQLFIAGDLGKQNGLPSLFPDPRSLAAELGVSDRIIYRFVEEKDKPALYSGAEAFVYPSSYEGFGLPPLEAMSCGAPVICSNRTSLPEVVGDAAITLNPDDTGAMVDAMYGVLTNQTLRADLSERSLQRAAQFNWRKTAIETIAVYEEVFAQRQR
nr:glycosyltransferase family 1 protein [Ktedonobacteraceae bacterium]